MVVTLSFTMMVWNFTVTAGVVPGSARSTNLGPLPLEEGLCVALVFMYGSLLVDTTLCEKRQLITALVPVITVELVAFICSRTLGCFILSQWFIL